MIPFNLMNLVLEKYNCRHYFFRVAKANRLDIPVAWEYGDIIKLPPRVSRKKLADADYRRKTMTYNPLGY